MNAITKTEAARPSLIASMAAKRNMDPDQFARTVRAMIMPSQHTNEQFAALMLVADKYDLDPILKEIYAFPAKGGGIVPIVSIDGWINLINSHPQYDGAEFDFDHAENGDLISCTCRMFRKDRSRPITVTEYLSECIRSTDPWKMKHRMLRHKTMIQTARYAFGFAGIYDEDEGEKIAAMRDVTPAAPPAPPVPPAAPVETAPTIDHVDDAIAADLVEEFASSVGQIVSDSDFFRELEDALAVAGDAETVEEVWTAFDPMARFEGQKQGETSQGIALALKKNALRRIGG
jgi:phage recombination protein Bet